MLGTATIKDLERFSKKIERTTGCWDWLGTLNSKGYGQLWIKGRHLMAHRIAYALSYGSIPEGAVIDHRCRNRRCVNPEHLEPVTNHENILRGLAGKFPRKLKTHCKNGHEFTPENTYINQGKRYCRSCSKERVKKFYKGEQK